MLLSWMFNSSYTTIYFFVKKFIFSNVYVSVNTILDVSQLFQREYLLTLFPAEAVIIK